MWLGNTLTGLERNQASARHYYRLHNGSGLPAVFGFAMPGFRALLVRSRKVGETVLEHCEPHHRIMITLAGQSAATIAETQDAAPVTRPDQAGSVTVVPADTA